MAAIKSKKNNRAKMKAKELENELKPKITIEKWKRNNRDSAIILAVIFFIIFSILSIEYVYVQFFKDITDINLIIQEIEKSLDSFHFHFIDVFSRSSTLLSALKMIGLSFVICVMGGIFYYSERLKYPPAEYKNAENGSAKWNDSIAEYDIDFTEPYGEPNHNGINNAPITKNVYLGMDNKKTRRNLNMLVVGGSGSGKSFSFIRPSILQANCSFVVTDPAGDLLAETGNFLEKQGYTVKVFNLVDMEASCCYNPFDHIRDENGVLMLIDTFIKNTNDGKSGGDPFWEKSEKLLLQALFFYLIEERPPKDRCFDNVVKLIKMAEIDENNPNAKSPVDILMEDLKKKNPHSLAVSKWTEFKLGGGKTLKSVLISVIVRIEAFELPKVRNLIRTDMEHPDNNIDLRQIGDKKTALFVIIPTADGTFNFLASMLYAQLFETLYFHSENEMDKGFVLYGPNNENLQGVNSKEIGEELIQKYKKSKVRKYRPYVNTKTKETTYKYALVYKNEDGEDEILETNIYSKVLKKHRELYSNANIVFFGKKKLNYHVRFLLDEFANIGQIPDFDKKLATMRKHEISADIVLQNLAQFENLYEKQYKGMVGNCDTFLFLGSPELETCKYVSELLGKTTQHTESTSVSKKQQNKSFGQSARELYTPDEIKNLNNDIAIVLINHVYPFKDRKNFATEHKNWKSVGTTENGLWYSYLELFENKIKDEKVSQKQHVEQPKDIKVIREHKDEIIQSKLDIDKAMEDAEVNNVDELMDKINSQENNTKEEKINIPNIDDEDIVEWEFT